MDKKNSRLKRIWCELIRGFREFGETVGVLVNTVLLGFVYVFIVGGVALCARFVGKRFFDSDINRTASSYWNDLNLTTRPLEEYYRQF